MLIVSTLQCPFLSGVSVPWWPSVCMSNTHQHCPHFSFIHPSTDPFISTSYWILKRAYWIPWRDPNTRRTAVYQCQFLSYSATIRLPATTTMTSYYFVSTTSRKPGKLTSMSCYEYLEVWCKQMHLPRFGLTTWRHPVICPHPWPLLSFLPSLLLWPLPSVLQLLPSLPAKVEPNEDQNPKDALEHRQLPGIKSSATTCKLNEAHVLPMHFMSYKNNDADFICFEITWKPAKHHTCGVVMTSLPLYNLYMSQFLTNVANNLQICSSQVAPRHIKTVPGAQLPRKDKRANKAALAYHTMRW